MDNVSKMTSTDLLERLLGDGAVDEGQEQPTRPVVIPPRDKKKGLRREIAELRAENRALLAGYIELAQWIKEGI